VVTPWSSFPSGSRPTRATAARRPRGASFTGGAAFEIEAILDRWYQGGPDPATPVLDYFKVKTADGAIHLLRYERGQGRWSWTGAASRPPS